MNIPFFSKKSTIKTEDLQKEINGLRNQLEEEIDSNIDLLLQKSIIDSNGSEPIAGQFGLLDEQYDKAMLQKLFMTETWLYIAVQTVAESIACLPHKLEKKKIIKQNITYPSGETEEVYRETWIDASAEPESNLFKYPNDMQTPVEFWMLVIIDLLATGDAYIFPLKTPNNNETNSQDRLRDAISRVRKTDVEGLYRINSAQVEVLPSDEDGKFIDGYALVSDGGVAAFQPEDLIHIKLPNPSNPFYGLAPVVAVMKKVLLDRYTDEHHMRFYKQGARLGGAIETTKKLTKEQLSRLTKTFESNFTGKRQHHKTLILPEGMKYKVIEQSPVEGALIEFSKMNKEPILAAYKVPPIKVGLLDGATYANALIQNKTFYENAVKPILAIVEQSINKDPNILRSSRNLRFGFDLSQVEALQVDNKDKADSGQSMLSAGLTVNEVRSRLWDLPPLDGGDTTPAISSAAPSLFNLSADDDNEEKVDTTNAQNDTEALSDIVPTEATFESRVAQLVNQAVADGLDIGIATERAIMQALQEGFLPSLIPVEEEEEDDSKMVSPFSKEAMDNYSKQIGDGVDPLISEKREEVFDFFKRLEKFLIKNIRNKAYRKDIGFGIKADLPDDEAIAKFIKQESKAVSESMIKASKHGYKFNLPSKTMTFPNEDAEKILKKIATRNVKSVTKTSIKQLKNIITSSASEQVSVGELSTRIQDAFDSISKSKAETIARTETLTAVSVGQELKSNNFKAQYPEEAKGMKRVWITAKDERVRGTHASQDSMVRPVGKDFPNGLKYPRDPSGEAGEVINCRCTFVDYLPEDSDDILSILG